MKSVDVDSSELDTSWEDSDADLKYVTPEEGAEILDRQARKYLGMSGEDFVRMYEAGEIDDPCRSDVMRVSMLIPLAQPK